MQKSHIHKFILDTLFPITCLSCGKEKFWLCDECFDKIKGMDFQVCPFCEKEITPQGTICQKCRSAFLTKEKSVPLDALIVSSSYQNRFVSKIIHLLKYNFVKELGSVLGLICRNSLAKSNLPIPDAVLAVPLHPRRLRWRGFNQSELIAEDIAQNLCPGFSLPILSNLVVRQKFTPPQMKIRNYQERKNNLKEAFALNPKIKPEIQKQFIQNKKILLVDDVATTGATLFELGKLLKNNGAKKVYGVVVARQEITVGSKK